MKIFKIFISFDFVGMTRFELATSGPPDRCATGLRHIPSSKCACKKKLALRVWLATNSSQIESNFRFGFCLSTLYTQYIAKRECKGTTFFAKTQTFSVFSRFLELNNTKMLVLCLHYPLPQYLPKQYHLAKEVQSFLPTR